MRQFGGSLNRGTILVSSTLEETHLLVGVIEEVADATGESVARRFGYAYVDSFGTVTPAGPAPYLDCVAAPRTLSPIQPAPSRGWQVLKTKPRAGLSPTNSPTTRRRSAEAPRGVE